MRKKLAYFATTLLLALGAVLVFVSPTTRVGAQGASCQAQCKVSYSACVKNASNPGGLNQCKKAYQECLSLCH